MMQWEEEDANSLALEVPPDFLPNDPTTENYRAAWSSNHFGRYFLNSVFVASLSTVGSVALSAMLAFTFARFEFPGRLSTETWNGALSEVK